MSASVATPTGNPAEVLVGRDIEGGWRVTERLPSPVHVSPGYFSVGYIVERNDGKTGFLKALDLRNLLLRSPTLEALNEMTTAFRFEVRILEKCKSRRMDRVVTALQHGTVLVDGYDPALANVPYIIFEKAQGDIRRELDAVHANAEVAFRLRALHHITTGLVQLHGVDIAHQDLKPANVLVFKPGQKSETRVGDLGTASEKGQACPRDECEVAGDRRYAPPEQLYGYLHPDWAVRRFAGDAYQLGALLVFLFTRSSVTLATRNYLHPDHQWGGTWKGAYSEVLPYYRQAWERVMENFDAAVRVFSDALAPELGSIARQLCEPDPELRGHPLTRARPGNSYSLVRYQAMFDRLANQAYYGRI